MLSFRLGYRFTQIITSFIFLILITAGLDVMAAPPPTPPWNPACHSVALVYRALVNGVSTSTLESTLKSKVNGVACLPLKKWDLFVDSGGVNLAATQAANPGIIISYTGHQISLRMGYNQSPGSVQPVKIIGTGGVEGGDHYTS